MAVREATVRGVWVIAMNAGGMAEDLIPGQNGIVTPMGNFDNFNEAVCSSFDFKRPASDNLQDSNIRNFAEQAEELISQFYN
jgi:glycosyltransferase involved in cell wall biosynthesis